MLHTIDSTHINRFRNISVVFWDTVYYKSTSLQSMKYGYRKYASDLAY